MRVPWPVVGKQRGWLSKPLGIAGSRAGRVAVAVDEVEWVIVRVKLPSGPPGGTVPRCLVLEPGVRVRCELSRGGCGCADHSADEVG